MLIDITGQKFGRLLVLSRVENSKQRGAMWSCVCDCGGACVILGRSLRIGNTKSCGCLRRKLTSERCKGKPRSEETKRKLSEANKREKNPNFGKPRSEETRAKLSKAHLGLAAGEKHPNWKGGISCEPYCEIWTDKEYKDSIRKRDNYKCQNPDCWKTFNPDKALSIHHINFIKKDCNPKNLITLCSSCNSRANKNRKKCIVFYQTIIEEKYEHQYSSI